MSLSILARGPKPPALTACQAAEATLGRSHALERALTHLDPRQAAILSAIAALDGGRRAEVERAAEAASAAGHADVAAVLELVLAQGSVNPTRLRKDAAARGLGSASKLPFPEMLRLLAVSRNGSRGQPAAELRQLCPRRPALDGYCTALSSRAEQGYYFTRLRELLPRAEQVCTTYMSLDRGVAIGPSWLGRLFERPLLDLSPARWPDLGPRTPEHQLRSLLSGNGPWPVEGEQGSELYRWLSGQPTERRHAWVGAILGHLERRVRAGRVAGLEGAIRLAQDLVERDARLSGLGAQLQQLQLRVEWVTRGQVPGLLLAALWRERQAALPQPARLALARRILAADDEEIDSKVLDEAQLVVLAGSSDPDALSEALQVYDDALPEGWAARLGALGAPPERIEEIRALDLAFHGSAARALERVPALARAGGWEVAWRVVAAMNPATELGNAALRRASAAALEALLTGPPTADLTRAVLRLTGLSPPSAQSVAAWLERWFSVENTEAAWVGVGLALAGHFGPPERAQALVREEGRRLRRLPGPEADARVAAVLVRACDLPSGGLSESQAQQLEPLTRFLLRGGPAAAIEALDRGAAGLEACTGHINWYLACAADQPEPERWRAWLARVIVQSLPVPAELLGELVADMDGKLKKALARRPRGAAPLLEDVMAQIAETIGRMLANDEIPW